MYSTVDAAQNCYELLSKFRIRETHLFRLHVICPGNFSNTSPVALRCPLATESSTITGPDGGGGGAKQEGRSLDVFLAEGGRGGRGGGGRGGGRGRGVVRPGKLWGEAMESPFRPT